VTPRHFEIVPAFEGDEIRGVAVWTIPGRGDEMRTVEYANTQSSIIYDLDLRFAFGHMLNKDLAGMNDPAGLAGRTPPCSSEANRRTIMRLMRDACANLNAAYKAEQAKEPSRYRRAMAPVFGTECPWPDWGL